jgi:hypothetical protein
MRQRGDLLNPLLVAILLAGPGQSAGHDSTASQPPARESISRSTSTAAREMGAHRESGREPSAGRGCGTGEAPPFIDCQQNHQGGIDYVFPGGKTISCRPNAAGGQDCW